MSSTTSIFAIILSAVLTNNFIFSQFLGCCPFLGCSSKIDTAAGMGLAVTFVMGLASAICWLVNCSFGSVGKSVPIFSLYSALNCPASSFRSSAVSSTSSFTPRFAFI